MIIDLNSDVGEQEDIAIEEALMEHITQASIACGGHAGDEQTMRRTAALARRTGVSVGAHPGYPDRANFGRIALPLAPEEVEQTVYEQVARLAAIAGELAHVKPHGALYNVAARNPELARAIARGVARWSREPVLIGLAGSSMLAEWSAMGFRTAAEGFADRRYEPDGSLRSRQMKDALITDPEAASRQALDLALSGRVQTLCIHSDTAGAVQIAARVAGTLRVAGLLRKR